MQREFSGPVSGVSRTARGPQKVDWARAEAKRSVDGAEARGLLKRTIETLRAGATLQQHFSGWSRLGRP